MWKSEGKVGSGQWAVGSKNSLAVDDSRARLFAFIRRRFDLVRRFVRRLLPTAHCPLPTILVILCTLLTISCRRDMQDQPKMKPFRSSPFFSDGLSTRPPIEGTVARGFLKTDTEFFTGKKVGKAPANAAAPSQTPAGPQPTGTTAGPALLGAAAYPDDVELFPIPITKEVVTRGKERYEIFCTACHGLTGNGDGMIVRRGFRRAASFNDERLRQAPVGHFFDAITNGWGAMPSYAPQIPAQDRWAIIAYIRALQLSQQSQSSQPTQTPAAAPAHSPATQSGGHQR
jgi:mono/diheme cytochrome c family protein